MRARSRPPRGALQGWGVPTPRPAPRGYALDPAFAAGSVHVIDLALCEVRLQRDSRFPWLILIPRVAAAHELEDLDETDHRRLMNEVVLAGHAVRAIGEALSRPVAKLNVAALGNITPQLHVHVVGRRSDDAAWPGPVWGASGATDYKPEALRKAMVAAGSRLAAPGWRPHPAG
jgi:diadenosine tetraphosphate (Ap4A) HIT family hydrolase